MIELLINNQKVDLSDDFDISITRSIADIKEPQSRSSDWSKTIIIPGTKFNNKVLGHIFEIGNEIIGSQFNPNKKADAVVLLDGMVQIEGFIRLTEIVVNDSKDISYNATIHGQTADLFTSLENAKLSDLDFSAYNHTLNITAITNSWSGTIGSGYVYAQMLPKRGTKNNNSNQWRADDHVPCLYAKTVIDEIFDGLGYTYTTDSFFNTDRFKRLILPYQFGALTTDASGVTNREFQAQVTGSTTLASGDTVPFANDSTSGNFDNGGNYDNTTYEYTVPNAGEYTFYLQVTTSTLYSPIEIASFNLLINGTAREFLEIPFDTSTQTGTVSVTRKFNSGDVIKIQYDANYDDDGRIIGGSTLAITPNTYFYVKASAFTLAYNNTVDFGLFFTGENTQKELILNFVKMFNLYIEETNSKELRIVPRDDFYDGNNVDWSTKLDYSQPTEIVPMGDLQSNPYVFTYKEADDELNKEYKESYGRTYGDRIVRIDNDFVKSEKKIEVTFAPTIMSQVGDRYYAYTKDEDSHLRVLYFGGTATTSTYDLYNDTPGTPSQTTYPLTLHIDDPSNMQFDLNFGMPQETFVVPGFEYSNQNLVNEYYFKTITEIADKDSKIFRGYFRITPNDWHNLRFNDLYFFENQYWRLNKVENYNPLQDGVFKCEFLLVTYYEPFSRNTGAVGVGTYDGSGVQGDRFPTDGKDGFLGTRSGGVNIGDNIGSDDNISTGDSNNVQGVYNTVLGGSNVSINEFQNNVTAIRCTDFKIPEGDRVYVENYPVMGTWLGSGKIVSIDNTDSPYSATYDDWLILCDTTSGSITVTLPDPTDISGKMFVVKKTASANSVTINAGDGSVLIDDATSHTDNAKNGYDQVVSDGTQYWIITHGH